MLKIDVWDSAQEFLDTLAAKQQRLIAARVMALRENALMPRSKQLEGFGNLRRMRAGHYRIIYFASGDTLHIVLVDKRNDDAIYRHLKRLLG